MLLFKVWDFRFDLEQKDLFMDERSTAVHAFIRVSDTMA